MLELRASKGTTLSRSLFP